jgi:hypothetical protein
VKVWYVGIARKNLWIWLDGLNDIAKKCKRFGPKALVNIEAKDIHVLQSESIRE